jgi:hypothetical protein
MLVPFSSSLRMVNAWATAIQDWIPEATEDILAHLDEFMYYANVSAGYNADVDSCFDLADADGYVDESCLYQVAEESSFAPSIIGSIVGRQLNEYGKKLLLVFVNNKMNSSS